MIDVKNTLTELGLLKKYHTEIVEASLDGSVRKVHEGCLVAINHAINLIEDMDERIAIMAEGKPDVVYCGECKRAEQAIGGDCLYCPRMDYFMNFDFYCGNGERREKK